MSNSKYTSISKEEIAKLEKTIIDTAKQSHSDAQMSLQLEALSQVVLSLKNIILTMNENLEVIYKDVSVLNAKSRAHIQNANITEGNAFEITSTEKATISFDPQKFKLLSGGAGTRYLSFLNRHNAEISFKDIVIYNKNGEPLNELPNLFSTNASSIAIKFDARNGQKFFLL